VVMLAEMPHEALAAAAERFRRALADHPFVLPGGEHAVTASLGAVAYPASGDDVAALVQAADVALYAAKRAGRNRVVLGDGAPPIAATA